MSDRERATSSSSSDSDSDSDSSSSSDSSSTSRSSVSSSSSSTSHESGKLPSKEKNIEKKRIEVEMADKPATNEAQSPESRTPEHETIVEKIAEPHVSPAREASPQQEPQKIVDRKRDRTTAKDSTYSGQSNRRRDDKRRRGHRRRSRSRSSSHSRSGSRSRSDRRHMQRRSYSRDRRGDRIDSKRSGQSNRNRSRTSPSKATGDKNNAETIAKQQQKTVDILTSKTGGAYIPPAKLRLLQAAITDKASIPYQRIAWEALKKSIHGFINKVNVDNIGVITRQLLKENIVRGRGLLCRSIIQAQAASPTFTHVYAALVAIINVKFPNTGELLLHRLVIQFKRGFRRNDKAICLSSSRFIAHLINQRVAHEILALEILTLLVETPTDDSVEVAIAFLKECGMKLQEVSSKGVNAIFEMLKNILHEGKLEKRIQYMIEVVFQVRKDGFKDHIAVVEALELVEEDEQFTHLIMLDEATDTQDGLSKYRLRYCSAPVFENILIEFFFFRRCIQIR